MVAAATITVTALRETGTPQALRLVVALALTVIIHLIWGLVLVQR